MRRRRTTPHRGTLVVKRFRLLAVALAVGLVAAACGGSDTSSSST